MHPPIALKTKALSIETHIAEPKITKKHLPACNKHVDD